MATERKLGIQTSLWLASVAFAMVACDSSDVNMALNLPPQACPTGVGGYPPSCCDASGNLLPTCGGANTNPSPPTTTTVTNTIRKIGDIDRNLGGRLGWVDPIWNTGQGPGAGSTGPSGDPGSSGADGSSGPDASTAGAGDSGQTPPQTGAVTSGTAASPPGASTASPNTASTAGLGGIDGALGGIGNRMLASLAQLGLSAASDGTGSPDASGNTGATDGSNPSQADGGSNAGNGASPYGNASLSDLGAQAGITGDFPGLLAAPNSGDELVVALNSGSRSNRSGGGFEFGWDNQDPVNMSALEIAGFKRGDKGTMLGIDPADYFARLDLRDSLFKIVARRYRLKSMQWAVVDVRKVSDGARAMASEAKRELANVPKKKQ